MRSQAQRAAAGRRAAYAGGPGRDRQWAWRIHTIKARPMESIDHDGLRDGEVWNFDRATEHSAHVVYKLKRGYEDMHARADDYPDIDVSKDMPVVINWNVFTDCWAF